MATSGDVIVDGYWRCSTNNRLHKNGTSCIPSECTKEMEYENVFNPQMGMRESASMFKGERPTIAQLEEILKEDNSKQNIKINPDGSITTLPILAIIDDEIALEALNNNILILEDAFRTGFECKACDGEGHTKQLCTTCGGNKVVAHNPEFSAAAALLSEQELELLPPHFAESLKKKREEQDRHKIVSGGLMPCTKCQVSDKRGSSIISGFQQCTLCKGFGASMVVPEDSMRRPTSGKVVSLGPLCKFLKAGDHVVYSNMMGHATKFKGKDVLRVMREDEIMMRIHGTKPENFQRKVTS